MKYIDWSDGYNYMDDIMRMKWGNDIGKYSVDKQEQCNLAKSVKQIALYK